MRLILSDAQATAHGRSSSRAASVEAFDAASVSADAPSVPLPSSHSASEDHSVRETDLASTPLHESHEGDGQLPAAADGDSVECSDASLAGSSAVAANAERACSQPVQLLTEDAPAVAAAAQAAGIEEGALNTAIDGPRAAAKNKVVRSSTLCVSLIQPALLLRCSYSAEVSLCELVGLSQCRLCTRLDSNK